MNLRALLFLLSLTIVPGSLKAVLTYEVDATNDLITFSGSDSGGPTSISGSLNVVTWANYVSSTDNSGDIAMSYLSGSVDVTGNTIDGTTVQLTSDGTQAGFNLGFDLVTSASFSLTFNSLTYSYASASAAQKTALEDGLFGANLPITNLLGSLGDLSPVPEPANTAVIVGCLALVGVGMLRWRRAA